MPKLISTAVLARKLGISQRTVQRKIKSGEIPATKQGRGFVVETLTTKEYAERRGITVEEARSEVKTGRKGAQTGGRGTVIPPAPVKQREIVPEPLLDEIEETGEDETVYFGAGFSNEIWPGTHSPSEFEAGKVRKGWQFKTEDQAINYANEIPVPTIVFRRPDGVYQVALNYP